MEATILAPNGQLQVYDPLVINQGTTPAVAPTRADDRARARRSSSSVGFNGNDAGTGGPRARAQGNCIDAFGNSIIDQMSAVQRGRTSTGWPTPRSPAAR